MFSRNIDTKGRMIRAVGAAGLLIGGVLCLGAVSWLGVVLLISSGFVFFEAVRGWCALRACGIKTKF